MWTVANGILRYKLLGKLLLGLLFYLCCSPNTKNKLLRRNSTRFHSHPKRCFVGEEKKGNGKSNKAYSPVARPGGSGRGSSPPLACKKCKIARFWCFWGRFWREKNENSPPKGIWRVPKLWSSCRDSAWNTAWTSEFGWKIRLNFGDIFFFFLGDHLFLGWKSGRIPDFGRKIRPQFRGRSFFFRFGDHLFFELKKRSNFRFWTKNPCDSDTRTMKIRVKVACSCLTLSKKAPPFFKSWLRACYSQCLRQSKQSKETLAENGWALK